MSISHHESGTRRDNKTRRADYLAYSIMDGIIDHYFVVLEKTGSLIEQLEEELLYMPGRRTMAKLHRLKRDMLAVRKTVWPLVK